MSNALEKIIDLKNNLQCELANAVGDEYTMMEEKKETYEYLKKFLRINCHHKWVTDTIDLLEGYREGVQIKYCEICEINY
tara:strand:+ start:699 stop:938 length:240 start_codon:yes stop_codon:yes gene_type:complete